MIKLENISKVYKVGGEDFYALKDVSLEIKDGEFTAICGASGSGKTTLLNIIGLLDDCTEGQYTLDGEEVARLSDRKKSKLRNSRIGFVVQDFALIDTQSVRYNVQLPLLFGDVPYREIRKRSIEALRRVGLEDQAGKRADQLSGGQRQRVALARAIVTNPSILLADEPTGQLDSETSRQIIAELKALNDDGLTVVIVTHDDKVAAAASRIIRLSDGQIGEEYHQ